MYFYEQVSDVAQGLRNHMLDDMVQHIDLSLNNALPWGFVLVILDPANVKNAAMPMKLWTGFLRCSDPNGSSRSHAPHSLHGQPQTWKLELTGGCEQLLVIWHVVKSCSA